MADACLKCHTPADSAPFNTYKNTWALDFAWIIDDIAYFDFDCAIEPALYQKLRDTLFAMHAGGYGFSRAVMLIKSFGGSLYDALAIINIIEEIQARGIVVETRVHGDAMSAGFLIMLAGDVRLASRISMLMWHEIITFEFFKVEDVSSKENEAETIRYNQELVNSYLAERSNLTKKEIDEMVKHRELWATGAEALEYGFIDGYLN
jgi:ATP-dependent protease ClpP protease subunit